MWQPDQPKTYVQDLLRRQAKELWSLLQAGAYVYLCGDARHMAPAVRKTLHGILISEGGYTPEQAEEQIHTWRTQGRYCEDVWAAT